MAVARDYEAPNEDDGTEEEYSEPVVVQLYRGVYTDLTADLSGMIHGATKAQIDTWLKSVKKSYPKAVVTVEEIP